MSERRDFLKMAGLGLAYASGLVGCGRREAAAPQVTSSGAKSEEFFFVQVTDTHWGYSGPANPEADLELGKAVARINALDQQPDFVVFTGDITHTTDDGAVRRERMRRARQLIDELRVKNLRFLPGEHDASPDAGAAFRETFGATRWSFDHRGVHFVALDNVSDPASIVGEEQRRWLRADLARVEAARPIVVFAHRPLFALYPEWDWHTKDGQEVIDVLAEHENVTVFYGHIHQEHHHTTGRIAHHAARSLVFPLPKPGSVPKRQPLPWDAASQDHGLGFREVRLARGAASALEVPLT